MNKLRHIIFLAIVLFFPFFAEGGMTDWLITPGVSVGKIKANTSEAALIKIFGARNVKSADIIGGEGETFPGAIIFPNEPEKKLEIIWKNAKSKSKPLHVIIRGDHHSKWKTRDGITLGTSLKEIERINGKSFALAGFGWDGGGTIYDFNGGKLCAKGYCPAVDKHGNFISKKIYIALEPKNNFADKSFMNLYVQVEGDRSFSSSHPALQQLNPKVNMISVKLNEE